MSRGDGGDCRARDRGGLQSPDSVMRAVEKQGGQAGVQAEGPASRLAAVPAVGVPRSRRAPRWSEGAGAGGGGGPSSSRGLRGWVRATGRYTGSPCPQHEGRGGAGDGGWSLGQIRSGEPGELEVGRSLRGSLAWARAVALGLECWWLT